jgi:hypothetical protein
MVELRQEAAELVADWRRGDRTAAHGITSRYQHVAILAILFAEQLTDADRKELVALLGEKL